MNVFIVYAHPEPSSFNAALKDVAVQVLTAQGHAVRISDLYAMRWSPILDESDFEGPRPALDRLDLMREQEHAFTCGTQRAPVTAEQAKISWADLVIFQFPIWWFSMPAILKGWIDRVMSRGFAYSAGRSYDSGHFKGKRVMLCLTTGSSSTLYEPNGMGGDLLHVLWPIHNGILAFTGFTVLPPFAAWAPAKVSAEVRNHYLQDYAEYLRRLEETEPLFFHPRSDYDPSQRLLPGVRARSGVQWNPGAGQEFQDSAAGSLRAPLHPKNEPPLQRNAVDVIDPV